MERSLRQEHETWPELCRYPVEQAGQGWAGSLGCRACLPSAPGETAWQGPSFDSPALHNGEAIFKAPRAGFSVIWPFMGTTGSSSAKKP